MMRRLSALLLVLLLGCTGQEPVPATVPASSGALNASAFMSAVETLCDPKMQGRDAGTEGIVLARDYLVGRLASLGLQPAFVIDGKPSYTQPFELRIGRDEEGKPIMAAVHNVGALLPGVGELKDEVVVIGAHYDHVGFGNIGSRAKDQRGTIHPGADDNASGTAGVVLLAEHFTQTPRVDTAPRRTILFTCFAGEERGLHGSRYMTRNPEQYAFDADNINGMINMDMIGRLRNDELYVFTDQTGEQWRDWINQANQDVDLDLQWDVRPPGGSDHSLFIAVQVPAVFFNTWLHDDYHTPRDTPDKINAEGSIAVLRLVASLAERAATESDRIVFVQPQPRAPRPYLGVMLANAQGGALIEDVVDNSPMDKAGVMNGDVLLAMNDKTINSPGDIRGFLTKAKVGDEVTLRLKRGDEILERTVKLGRRG